MNIKKKHIIVAVSIAMMLSMLCCVKSVRQNRLPIYKLVRVVDGDTFIVNVKGKHERVRLLNVNTPESVHPDGSRNTITGRMISAAVKKLLPPGTDVLLQNDEGTDNRDRYNRLLRYMFIPGEITGSQVEYINFNVWLVKTGWSPYYTKYGQSKKYDKEFREAENYSKKKKMGIWGKIKRIR